MQYPECRIKNFKSKKVPKAWEPGAAQVTHS